MIYKFGLIGENLSHSFSPKLHRELMEKNGIQGTYSLIEIPRDKFESEFDKLKQSDYHGVNVTIPYKERVMLLLDSLSPQAQYIGAVNTISFINGLASGFNTDYDGFLHMMDANGLDIRNATAVLLGSGGVTKAVVKALIDRGIAGITVVSTKTSPSTDLETINYAAYESKPIRCDFLINCTPVGMHPNTAASPVTATAIRAGAVIDLIYNPEETQLLKDASALGAKTVNGMQMLVAQAAKAQEIWLSSHQAE